MSDLSERRGLRVGDKVFVAHGTYKGHYGIIVGGQNGSGFSLTSLSAYVQLRGSSDYHALRCASLAHSPPVPCLSSSRTSRKVSPVAVGLPVQTNRERLREMCSMLDALTLRSESEADEIIVAFAEAVLRESESGNKKR